MRRAANHGSPLHRAVTVQMRVLADLAARWFSTADDSEGCAGAWTRRGTLVVFANGRYADRIAGELERAELLVPQHDKPEHIDPVSRPREGEAMPSTERAET